jgi:hypothetical protein
VSEFALEGAAEGGFRFVADISGDFRHSLRRALKRPCRQLKPPARQVGHGRLGKISCKALHERGPGNAHLVRQIRNRPGVGDAVVHQAEAFPHDGIARPRQPSGLLFGQAGNVAPQRIDEQGF